MKTKISRLHKIAATATALCVAFTQIAVAAPAFSVSAREVSLPDTLRLDQAMQISVPSAVATVDKLIPGNGKTIFHIQTAHGQYQAEKQIEFLLAHLEKNYGVETLLMEGASEALNPEIINFFPEDRKSTLEVVDAFVRHSVISGPEVFLLNSGKTQGLGIEDEAVYEQNLQDFVSVVNARDAGGQFLSNLEIGIERLAALYLSSDARSFLKQVERKETGDVPFDIYLQQLRLAAEKYAGINLADASWQLLWPMLTRIFTIEKLEKKIDAAAFKKQKEDFLKAVKPYTSKAFDAHDSLYTEVEKLLNLKDLSARLPDPETSALFEALVRALPDNFNYGRFSSVTAFCGLLMLKSQLQIETLSDEITRMEDKIADRLAETKNAKALVSVLKDYRLLKKLFALELLPADFDKLTGFVSGETRGLTPMASNDVRPSALVKQVQQLNGNSRAKEVEFKNVAELDALYTLAVRFYEGARLRDTKMLERIEEHLDATGADKVAVVTGGFHSGPFAEYFEKRGYNYALMTPKLTTIDTQGRQNYLDVMQMWVDAPKNAASFNAGSISGSTIQPKPATPGILMRLASRVLNSFLFGRFRDVYVPRFAKAAMIPGVALMSPDAVAQTPATPPAPAPLVVPAKIPVEAVPAGSQTVARNITTALSARTPDFIAETDTLTPLQRRDIEKRKVIVSDKMKALENIELVNWGARLFVSVADVAFRDSEDVAVRKRALEVLVGFYRKYEMPDRGVTDQIAPRVMSELKFRNQADVATLKEPRIALIDAIVAVTQDAGVRQRGQRILDEGAAEKKKIAAEAAVLRAQQIDAQLAVIEDRQKRGYQNLYGLMVEATKALDFLISEGISDAEKQKITQSIAVGLSSPQNFPLKPRDSDGAMTSHRGTLSLMAWTLAKLPSPEALVILEKLKGKTENLQLQADIEQVIQTVKRELARSEARSTSSGQARLQIGKDFILSQDTNDGWTASRYDAEFAHRSLNQGDHNVTVSLVTQGNLRLVEGSFEVSLMKGQEGADRKSIAKIYWDQETDKLNVSGQGYQLPDNIRPALFFNEEANTLEISFGNNLPEGLENVIFRGSDESDAIKVAFVRSESRQEDRLTDGQILVEEVKARERAKSNALADTRARQIALFAALLVLVGVGAPYAADQYEKSAFVQDNPWVQLPLGLFAGSFPAVLTFGIVYFSARPILRWMYSNRSELRQLTQEELSAIADSVGQDLTNLDQSGFALVPTFAQPIDRSKLKDGIAIGLDIGGTNFRVRVVEIKNGVVTDLLFTQPIKILENVKTAGSSQEFFKFYTDEIVKALQSKPEVLARIKAEEQRLKEANEKPEIPVGFTFSFEVDQTSLTEGTVKRLSKGFVVNDLMGKDAVRELQTSISSVVNETLGVNLQVKALLNDTTATALAADRGVIGLILGTGYNIAVFLPKSIVRKIFEKRGLNPDDAQDMFINLEAGNTGAQGWINEYRANADRLVDLASENKGDHLFEKMVAGAYLGQIIAAEALLLAEGKTEFTDKELEPYLDDFKNLALQITSESLAEFIQAQDKETFIRENWPNLPTSVSSDEIEKMIKIVANRSAALVAASLAGIIRTLELETHPVAVDGSVYLKNAVYRGLLSENLLELGIQPETMSFSETPDGSSMGAALAGASVARSEARIQIGKDFILSQDTNDGWTASRYDAEFAHRSLNQGDHNVTVSLVTQGNLRLVEGSFEVSLMKGQEGADRKSIAKIYWDQETDKLNVSGQGYQLPDNIRPALFFDEETNTLEISFGNNLPEGLENVIFRGSDESDAIKVAFVRSEVREFKTLNYVQLRDNEVQSGIRSVLTAEYHSIQFQLNGVNVESAIERTSSGNFQNQTSLIAARVIKIWEEVSGKRNDFGGTIYAAVEVAKTGGAVTVSIFTPRSEARVDLGSFPHEISVNSINAWASTWAKASGQSDAWIGDFEMVAKNGVDYPSFSGKASVGNFAQTLFKSAQAAGVIEAEKTFNTENLVRLGAILRQNYEAMSYDTFTPSDIEAVRPPQPQSTDDSARSEQILAAADYVRNHVKPQELQVIIETIRKHGERELAGLKINAINDPLLEAEKAILEQAGLLSQDRLGGAWNKRLQAGQFLLAVAEELALKRSEARRDFALKYQMGQSTGRVTVYEITNFQLGDPTYNSLKDILAMVDPSASVEAYNKAQLTVNAFTGAVALTLGNARLTVHYVFSEDLSWLNPSTWVQVVPKGNFQAELVMTSAAADRHLAPNELVLRLVTARSEARVFEYVLPDSKENLSVADAIKLAWGRFVESDAPGADATSFQIGFRFAGSPEVLVVTVPRGQEAEAIESVVAKQWDDATKREKFKLPEPVNGKLPSAKTLESISITPAPAIRSESRALTTEEEQVVRDILKSFTEGILTIEQAAVVLQLNSFTGEQIRQVAAEVLGSNLKTSETADGGADLDQLLGLVDKAQIGFGRGFAALDRGQLTSTKKVRMKPVLITALGFVHLVNNNRSAALSLIQRIVSSGTKIALATEGADKTELFDQLVDLLVNRESGFTGSKADMKGLLLQALDMRADADELAQFADENDGKFSKLDLGINSGLLASVKGGYPFELKNGDSPLNGKDLWAAAAVGALLPTAIASLGDGEITEDEAEAALMTFFNGPQTMLGLRKNANGSYGFGPLTELLQAIVIAQYIEIMA